eukprot:4487520-Karenia_brevis.AAC.1
MPEGGKYFMLLSRVMDHTPWFAIAAIQFLLGRLDSTGVQMESMWCDVGRHFLCYRFWAYWLDHIPTNMKVGTTLNYFPGGHGKTKLDGLFGKRQRWTKQAAFRQRISTEQQLVKILNQRAAQASKVNPTAPAIEFILFTPPPKDALPQKTFCGEFMRKHDLNCAATYALSSTLVKGRACVHDHKLTGQAR